MAYMALFHGGNTGSNPVGDASLINELRVTAETVSRLCPACAQSGSLTASPR